MALSEESIPTIGIGDLEMKGKLGKGAGGDVYKCYWKPKDIHVALKQVSEDWDREVQTMSRIKHPNIIKLYATTSMKDMLDTRFYIVLELAENGSLYEHFQKTPMQPDLERSFKWAEEIANGMAYLHEQAQAHRDLKSQNVLLTKDWIAKIGDFGSTKELNRTTAATARTGTYGWMAPEVLRHKAYSKKCDVYSFGMLLWELITHDEPYRGLSATQIQLEVAKENGKRPPIPSSCGPKLKKLIEDCWQDDPEKRPEFKGVLSSLLAAKAENNATVAKKPMPKPAPFRVQSIPRREEETDAGMVSAELSELELGERLGEGAFTVVYRGRWRDREVAIREVKTTADHDSKIFSSLPHDNLIRLFAVAESPTLKYLVTELAEYGDLCKYMEERRGQPEHDRIFKWAIEIAEGMCFLHEKNIAHRGLKSGNVMLTADLTAKVDMSFYERHVSETTMMTLVGIDAWTAPEMMMTKPCNKQVDVYSYGVLLWELMTYCKPWDSLADNAQILSAITKGERPEIPESTSDSVKDLIEKCWQTKPEKRPCFESILYSLEEYEMGKMEYEELEFKKRVGRGTFAVVWKGYWKTKKAGKLLVAIKNITDMDKTEVIVSSSLRHPKIIRFYGCVESPLHVSLVTEFAENGSVGSYIEARLGKPEKERAWAWGKEIAEGMQYLHGRGYGHRDLNSSNVVLVSDWTAKICDLATCRKMKHAVKLSLAGTFAWMPPEMMMEEPSSKMCDVYSYAIVLWELVTFKVPFEGLPDMVILMDVTSGARPDIPKDCDKFFSDLIKRCWVDDQEERPSFDDILKEWQK